MVKKKMSLNKNIYRVLLIGSFILINVLVLFGIGNVLSYFKTGADRSQILHLEVKNKDVYLPKMQWASIDNPGRSIEEQTLQEIQEDYLDSWYIRNVSYKTNERFGIDDFYTDSSRVNLYKHIHYNKKNDITVEATSIEHHPEIEFYSADGQLVVFTDKKVKEYERVNQKEKIISENKFFSDYRIMMLLEDGFWRIRHLVRQPSSYKDSTLQKHQFYNIKENQVYKNDTLFRIKGINYYPQKTPWDMFGNRFDKEVIENDFKIIKKTGLNTIRVFIQYEDFGKAEVEESKLEKLRILLDTAQKTGLKVIITLFDFYGDYSVLDWTLTHRHAERIVTTFKDHKAILAWDIKNEPDLDFKSRGKEKVIAWLKEMAWQIRSFDSNHFITIGWFDHKNVSLVNDEIDFISYHFYGSQKFFEKEYLKLKKRIPDKPLVLQEYGLSSYNGLWNVFGSSKQEQANYHEKMQAVFTKNNIQFISWTLYDFEQIPEKVVGKLPWRKSKQKYFGFIDKKGKEKPSFQYINSN